MKVCQNCGEEIHTKDGDNECRSCEDALGDHHRRIKARQQRWEKQGELNILYVTITRAKEELVYVT